MTQHLTTPQFFAQGVHPTVPNVTPEEIGFLCSIWIRYPEIFRSASNVIQPFHFGHLRILEIVWTALCIADRQHHGWSEQLLIDLVHEQVIGRADPLMPDQLDSLTRRGPGGFIYDAFALEISNVDLEHASQLQQRFIEDKTILSPLLQYVNQHVAQRRNRPENIEEFIESLRQQYALNTSVRTAAIQSVADEWRANEARIGMFRGRRMVGLETGFSSLDAKTLGLRGVTLLGAAPRVGKTVLCLQLAMGVCQRFETNDAVVIFLSLELSSDALMSRLKCHLTRSDWASYVLGEPQTDGHREFTAQQAQRQVEAFEQISSNSAACRLSLVDRRHFAVHSADRILAMITQLKQRMNATRALVIIDYIQLLELPQSHQSRSDLDADKARLRVLQEVVERSLTSTNPFGDAVLAVSEARKPVGDARKSQIWGATSPTSWDQPDLAMARTQRCLCDG